MNYLLDTNAALWSLNEPARLESVAEVFKDSSNQILLSDVSLWEIAVKMGVGKLTGDLARMVLMFDAQGFARLAIERRHILRLRHLPMHHRDPFDRLIAAQAIEEETVLITSDHRLRDYPIKILACG